MEKFALVWKTQAEVPTKYHPLVLALVKAAKDYRGEQKTARQKVDTDFAAALAARGGDSDASRAKAVRAYEVGYRASSKSFDRLWAKMREVAQPFDVVLRRGTGVTEQEIYVELPLTDADREKVAGQTQDTPWGTKVEVQPTNRRQVLGTAYGKTARFCKAAAKPAGCPHGFTLVHRESRVQYIVDKNNRPVRRFVKRAINEHDATNLDGTNALRSHIHPESPQATTPTDKEVGNFSGRNLSKSKALTEDQRVLFHLQKGSNRFISATTTDHTVVSNSGESFDQEGRGFVIVDLALVPQADIRDVHTEEAITGQIKVSPTTFEAAFGARVEVTPEVAAVRDVVRTREVLIEGFIPIARLFIAAPTRKTMTMWQRPG